MNKEQVFKLMDTIPPDLVEEADIKAPSQRHMPKIARAGLIAACLCLALLGTAFAANPAVLSSLIDRLTVQPVSQDGSPGYSITSTPLAKYPLSAFSPALLDASENRDGPVVSLLFDTWDEVQAFLGPDIPCVWPHGWETDWYQVVLFHTGSEVLWGIDINSFDYSRQADIYVEIRTELWRGETFSAGLGALDGGNIQQLPSYLMSNGATAELFHVTDPELVYADGTLTGVTPQHSFGYFMRDGILYRVTAYSPVPPQKTVEAQIHMVLDSFP